MGTVPEAYYEFVMHYAPYFYVIPTLLAEDASEGQKFVNVVDGSKFQTKFPVEIKDDAHSEWNIVDTVNGNVLTMENNLANTYYVSKNDRSIKLQNERIKKITFHTFRHWKATTEYAKTKDILRVMKMLGHKSIQNTLLYTQLVNFENDEYHSSTAKTVEEAQKLVEAGFEYVCNFEDIKLFRKRK